MRHIKTQKGTELPLMDIKGKPYLQVAHRLVWFREEHPDWSIETDLQVKENACLACATIKDNTGRIIAMAHKVEDTKGFADFIEKSESGAIGRALAMCGYGTQFAPELVEGDKRIVDSPMQPAKKKIEQKPDDYVFTFGKFQGQSIKDVGYSDALNYLNYMKNVNVQKGVEDGPRVKEVQEALIKFFPKKV